MYWAGPVLLVQPRDRTLRRTYQTPDRLSRRDWYWCQYAPSPAPGAAHRVAEPNSEVRHRAHWASAADASRNFLRLAIPPVAGGTFTDAGTGACQQRLPRSARPWSALGRRLRGQHKGEGRTGRGTRFGAGNRTVCGPLQRQVPAVRPGERPAHVQPQTRAVAILRAAAAGVASKRRSRSASAMPGPPSATVTATCPAAASTATRTCTAAPPPYFTALSSSAQRTWSTWSGSARASQPPASSTARRARRPRPGPPRPGGRAGPGRRPRRRGAARRNRAG